MRFTTRSFLIGASACFCLLFFACGKADIPSASANMEKYKFVRIATNPANPPFEFGAGTRIEGIDIEIGNAIAGDLGYDVKWVTASQDNLMQMLARGQVELVISAFAAETPVPQPFRQQIAYSEPYFTSFDTIVRRKDATSIRDFRDLADKRVGVQAGTTAAAFMASKAAPRNVQIKSFPTLDDGLSSVNLGTIDAMVGDAAMLHYSIQQSYHYLVVLEHPADDTHFVVATRKQEEPLRRQADAAIQKLKSSGRLQQLLDEALNPGVRPSHK